ncbi:MAG TPA: SDR family NAD(P)-dependent oxidoreductase [Stellaceae bacterium]|nr:SDR family NAD(P)-dependent oxidoreductase [Stellaceae bacterium]
MTGSGVGLFDLSGKVALVTGAGSGLGRAFAEGLAASGARVFCVDRDRGRAEETATLINQTRNDAVALCADIADPGAVERMARDAARVDPRLDILVNNAGIATVPMRTHEMPLEDWDRLMAVNLRGVFMVSRALIPRMLQSGGGSIINVASIVGLIGNYPGFAMNAANYAAAKAGVIGFTRQMAAEYAKDGIRANAIAPGWHGGTRLAEERRAIATPEEIARFEETILKGTPMGRRGTPDELQGLAIYLASDASRYVTGQVFIQDGGWTAV